MATITTLEKFEGSSIPDTMIKNAATLFSNNYGIWGPPAGAKSGQRVRISPKMLRSKCMAVDTSQNIYVRAMHENELVGNVFATRWEYGVRKICWVTQLCVRKDFRHQGLATRLLGELREDDGEYAYGILSSHPFAIAAALRAFGGGIEKFSFELMRIHARSIMASSPVEYVREAQAKGSIFADDGRNEEGNDGGDQEVHDGVVSCADTNFYVDHEEPQRALEAIRQKEAVWPFGKLPEGHEFLVIVDDARPGV